MKKSQKVIFYTFIKLKIFEALLLKYAFFSWIIIGLSINIFALL